MTSHLGQYYPFPSIVFPETPRAGRNLFSLPKLPIIASLVIWNNFCNVISAVTLFPYDSIYSGPLIYEEAAKLLHVCSVIRCVEAFSLDFNGTVNL